MAAHNFSVLVCGICGNVWEMTYTRSRQDGFALSLRMQDVFEKSVCSIGEYKNDWLITWSR